MQTPKSRGQGATPTPFTIYILYTPAKLTKYLKMRELLLQLLDMRIGDIPRSTGKPSQSGVIGHYAHFRVNRLTRQRIDGGRGGEGLGGVTPLFRLLRQGLSGDSGRLRGWRVEDGAVHLGGPGQDELAGLEVGTPLDVEQVGDILFEGRRE